MLTISPLRSTNDGNNREGCTGGMEANFSLCGAGSTTDEFLDFSGANLLDSIDFDDLFIGMHDGDMLPDLEMDPELLAEFSISGGEESETNYSSTMSAENNNVVSPNNSTYYDGNVTCVADGVDSISKDDNNNDNYDDDKNRVLKVGNDAKGGGLMSQTSLEEIESKKKDPEYESGTSVNSSLIEPEKRKKKHKSSSNRTETSNNTTNSQGKRKTKVDWTPELHRRFVQAVEQLGVDKAVPSRILELMGIDCLTRHNIASHLQKYRSHRKHLLAREAEAASWTQKRQMYGVAMGGSKSGGAPNISPWHPPTVGFPPMTQMHHHSFRPLHVWGHPTMDPQARLPMWPKQVMSSPTSLPPAWGPHPPPADPTFWHSPHHRRLPLPTIPVGVPPHPMYRSEHSVPPPVATKAGPHTPVDISPSKESIDAALGDVLAKPWLPLPIGLKPPSMDTVFVELQRQGVCKIPPTNCA